MGAQKMDIILTSVSVAVKFTCENQFLNLEKIKVIIKFWNKRVKSMGRQAIQLPETLSQAMVTK